MSTTASVLLHRCNGNTITSDTVGLKSQQEIDFKFVCYWKYGMIKGLDYLCVLGYHLLPSILNLELEMHIFKVV